MHDRGAVLQRHVLPQQPASFLHFGNVMRFATLPLRGPALQLTIDVSILARKSTQADRLDIRVVQVS